MKEKSYLTNSWLFIRPLRQFYGWVSCWVAIAYISFSGGWGVVYS